MSTVQYIRVYTPANAPPSIEALLRLHRKVKAADTVLDDPGRSDTSTTRAAWNEIRDNVARGASRSYVQLPSRLRHVVAQRRIPASRF